MSDEATQPRIWAGLARRADPSQYQPHAVPGVAEEQLTEGDQTYTVIRSPRGTYLRLTPLQRDLWQRMDGTQSVAQLATHAYLEHHQLLPIGELVSSLKREGFLAELPVGIYRLLAARLEARTAEGWGRRVLKIFAGALWQIPRLDTFYGTLYRAGGWLLFTPVAAALIALVSIAGAVTFIATLADSRASFTQLSIGGSVLLGLVTLWGALLAAFVLHESSHALAVKHYQRTILGGGLMLYYGMPGAFINTTDIWRSPQRARILVSAVGPIADLLVGSVATFAALWLEASAPNLASLCFKLAFASFASTLFNLNPLLELDGYFILVDVLRMPDLRRRALAFVRQPLWERALRRARLTGEERILAVFGVASALYTALIVTLAALVYQRQVLGPMLLLLRGDIGQRLLGALLLLVVVVPLLGALLLAGWGAGRAAIRWTIQRGYGRRPALLALVGTLAVCGLAGLAVAQAADAQWLATLLTPALWLAAFGALLGILPDYRGAAVEPAIRGLSLTTLCAAIAAIARAALPGFPIWVLFDTAAFLLLAVSGFSTLRDVDLRSMSRLALFPALMLLLGSFAVGGVALLTVAARSPGAPSWALLFAAAPASFGALALALLLPHLLDLRGARVFWPWALLWCGALVETAAYLVDLNGVGGAETARAAALLAIVGPGLWMVAWMTHLATLRQIAPEENRWPYVGTSSESERLTRAFQFCYASCYRLLAAVYGPRRARALDDRMDVLAATANWDVTLDRDMARIGGLLAHRPLANQGARYAEVLRYTVSEIAHIAGETFAQRAIRAAYDALPWQERETAGRLCFPDTPWARQLSSRFGDVRDARRRLLRQVELFAGCDDAEIDALVRALEEVSTAPGQVLLHAGRRVPGVWVVEAGEVTPFNGERQAGELHRGASFGAEELFGGLPAAHTYRSPIASSLLFIPDDQVRRLIQNEAPHLGEAVQSAAIIRRLEQIPLFTDLPRSALHTLARSATEVHFAPRAIIVRQSQPSGTLYLIDEGYAAVVIRDLEADAERRPTRTMARLGPQELFGELELLRGTPPTATIVALTELTALAIPHRAIAQLLHTDDRMTQDLRQIGTGRLRDLAAAR